MSFYSKFVELCAERNTHPSTVATEIGLTATSATGWKDGAKPRKVTITKIANYFGVPVSYFDDELKIEKSKYNYPPPVPVEEDKVDEDDMIELLQSFRDRDDMRMLFRLAKNATPEDVRVAANLIESLNKRYED